MIPIGLIFEDKSPYSTNPPDSDGLWKKLIMELFEEFILFFSPELHREIDFTKDPDFLKQELHKIIIKEKKGRNYTDQIVKVSLKNGKEKWLLIHVEVQDEVKEDFSERMFRYFYRIFDQFNHKIYAIALVTSEMNSTHPDNYNYSFHGTTINYVYNIYKFKDHTIEELEHSSNPFAAAVIAAKYANQTKKDAELRYYFKRKLMQQILRRFSRHDEQARIYIGTLFYFIDYLLKTPDELQEKLREEIIEFAEKEGFDQMKAKDMELSPTLASVIHALAGDRIEKGIKEGIEREIEKAKVDFAKNLMKENFSDDKIAELTELSLDKVKSIRESME